MGNKSIGTVVNTQSEQYSIDTSNRLVDLQGRLDKLNAQSDQTGTQGERSAINNEIKKTTANDSIRNSGYTMSNGIYGRVARNADSIAGQA